MTRLAALAPLLLAPQLEGFDVRARLEVGRAPHQLLFRPGGESVLVAVSGEHVLVELDVATRTETRRWEVPGTPLGVALPAGGDGPLVTRFAGDSVVSLAGDRPAELEVGAGPSFLVPLPDGRYLVSCERADTLAVLGGVPLGLEATHATGARPFPPAATSDGRLAFVPDHDGGTVTPVDLWNGRVYPAVPVGERPSGGAVLPGDVRYAVALRGEDRLAFLNTASRTVVGTLEEGIGDSPFDVVVAPGGRLAFVNNTGSADVSVVDVARRTVLGRVAVGEIPIAMAVRPDGSELWVSCEGTHEVVVVAIPGRWRGKVSVERAPLEEPTPVAVLGMLHGEHRESERWGLDELRTTIRRLSPEAVLTEIPPDRWERIWSDWSERGAIEDERLLRFPEYTDVLLPLASELGFEIVPCAAWTREMADLRRARMEAFHADPAFEALRAEYEEAVAAAEVEPPPGPEDDPLVLHSPAYDEWTRRRLRPYDELLGELIGPGGWTAINRSHMALIDRAIDERPGQRLLVTFGAGHKHWFLDRLREREDVRLVDVRPFLATGGGADAGEVELACRREVEELHRFFEEWFAGALPDSDAAFERCAGVLAPGFEIVGPDGARREREELLARLRAAHGSARGRGQRIWTRRAASRPLDGEHLLATYEEWQAEGGEPRGRTSSAVFRRAEGAPNGLVWVHVHETWIESTVD